MSESSPTLLKRELGWFSAAIMGLASVIGTGIFVSIGIAAGISGSTVIVALMVTGLLASCNSLNLAQLAVSHPVSGGIYEYGYKYLTPWLGFTGGWIYFLSKTAVAATAALGFSGYLLNSFGVPDRAILVPVAEISVLIITAIVLSGMRLSKIATIGVVLVTISSLLFLIIAGAFVGFDHGFEAHTQSGTASPPGAIAFFHSVALMFVSYNGAARISMVGEEIVDPKKNIPKAVILTVLITMVLYLGVTIVSLGSIGAEAFAEATVVQAAPLRVVADSLGISGASNILSIGAITSMLSILLTTILGVSRLLLAMGRRGDMPSILSTLNKAGTTPYWAVLAVGGAIATLVLIGDVRTTWALGTFGALIRCAIISLAALRMGDEERLYPKWLTWIAFAASLLLVFCVEWQYWLIGFGLIGLGLIWHFAFRQFHLANPDLSATLESK